eukprot:973591-Prymnesium_polylepis.3
MSSRGFERHMQQTLPLPRFNASAYLSVPALAARPLPTDGDLSVPAVLQAAVAARAFRGELIL